MKSYAIELPGDRERIARTEARKEVMGPEIVSNKVEDGNPNVGLVDESIPKR